MKLAEALILRSDIQSKLQDMRMRISYSSKVQEGEEPPENPESLLKECSDLLQQQKTLIQKINKTNSFTMFDDNLSISDLITERDILKEEISILDNVINSSVFRQDRYSKSEIKVHCIIDIPEMRKRIDLLSKKYREFDTKLQCLNWNTELI